LQSKGLKNIAKSRRCRFAEDIAALQLKSFDWVISIQLLLLRNATAIAV